MNINEKLEIILEELTVGLNKVDPVQVKGFIKQIKEANHIFLAGAGRSGLAINGFANRLSHLGFSVSVVGEISSPHSQSGDLLIIGSGSGETGSLVTLAKKAKNNNVSICVITMSEDSTIGSLANNIVKITGKVKSESSTASIQPMGTLFEQSCALFYDATVLAMMEELNETSETMFARHADFE